RCGAAARCLARASARSVLLGGSVSLALSGCAERPTLSPEIEFASRPMPTAARRPATARAAPVANFLNVIVLEASSAPARTRQAQGQLSVKRAPPPAPPLRAHRTRA